VSRPYRQVNQLYNLLFVYSFGIRDKLQKMAAGATAAGRGEFTVRAWRTLVGISEMLVRADLGSAMASVVSSLEEALAQARDQLRSPHPVCHIYRGDFRDLGSRHFSGLCRAGGSSDLG